MWVIMETVWLDLKARLLERLTPSDDEATKLRDFITRVEGQLTSHLRMHGITAKAEVHGSASRGTWIAGDKDIDIFIVLDPQYGRSVIPRVLAAVKLYVGEGWVEAYAEHPYITAVLDGFTVDFVPCFRVNPSEGLISSTDRTPLHTSFLRPYLTRSEQGEVLLLKRFMKGVGVYGAEVKVGGFSGYLCELLVVHYGSFTSVVRNVSEWRLHEVVDLFGESKVASLRERFKDPLIVVDPVDSARNVASAVSETSFSVLAAAARAFLSSPDIRFFYPPPGGISDDFSGKLRGRPSSLIHVVLDDGAVGVPDILWGELYKSLGGLSGLLKQHDFNVLRSAAWSDESSVHVLVFEVESSLLPDVVKRMGPPVGMGEDSDRFLGAHLGVDSTLSGPWIEGGRWWVLKRRSVTDARALLMGTLIDGGVSAGVSRKLGERVRDSFRVLMDGEVLEFMDSGFRVFLAEFLDGRPGWLV
jgi:tRNA nucleotidyltransferase (CCA-adding enzyme)